MAQTKINKHAAKVFTGLHRLVYKASNGRIGGGNGTIIILTTTGRASGKERERPLLSGEHPDGWIIIASFSGHDTHPHWYLNLQAEPEASVRVGTDVHKVTARVAEGEERDRLWAQMADLYPGYNEYQAVTDRQIPVVVLERRPS